MNDDFSPYRIRFTYTAVFHNDTTYRDYWETEDEAMRNAYAESPATQCNVYVVNVQDGWLGWGTFPWQDDALTATGGIVIHEGSFGAGDHTMSHEMGHNVGLWHTHHGVWEVPYCSECYERADGVDGDITGDMCSDTAPTPRNFFCADPGGTDGCSGVAWGSTDTQNYMGYAPNACLTEFSLQQSGRFHCWANDILTGWFAAGEKYCPACFTDSGNRTTCESSGTPPGEWISNVTFNTIDNTTGSENNGCSYGDYTGLSTVVSPGSTYTLSVTFCSEGTWTEHVRAWIDWNRNNVFESVESYYLGSGIDATLTLPITVPSGAAPGCTRMRVIDDFGSDPGPDGSCPDTSWGETEDYTVCVTGPGCGDVTVYAATDLGLAIPDGSVDGVSHTINVPDGGSVTDLDIDLDISHPWVGDLCVTVSHGAMAVTLIQRIGDSSGLGCDAVGCCGCNANNLAGIILDDEGVGAAVNDQCANDLSSPPNYVPDNPLSGFNGMNPQGDWVITVNDNAGGDVGTLNGWSLHICGITTVVCGDPDAGDCCADNGTPGCNDESCCESVCSYDPWCCVNGWDDICAGEAEDDTNCDCGGGDECADCSPVQDGTTGGTTLDNTGSVDDTSCGINDLVDEWLCYTASCTGVAKATTCNPGTEIDTTLAVFDACGGTELACNDDTVGAPAACDLNGLNHKSSVSWAVSAGATYYVRVAGYGGATGDYELTITCNAPLGPDCGCATDPAGEGFCSRNWACGTTTACLLDSHCGAGLRCTIDNCCPPPYDAGSCTLVCEEGCVNGGTCDTGYEVCGADPCGNGACEPGIGENCTTCPVDCPCADGEACVDGACIQVCGNGVCEPGIGENCATCPLDCPCAGGEECVGGACLALCGNGTCDPGENGCSCPEDCTGGCTALFFINGQQSQFDEVLLEAGKVLKDIEDFEENRLPPKTAAPLDDPLDANTNQGGFEPGDIPANIAFMSNVEGPGIIGPNPHGIGGMAVGTAGFNGAANVVVVANWGDESLDVLTVGPDAHTAMAINVVSFEQGGNFQVRVYDANNGLLGMTNLDLVGDPGTTWVGFIVSTGTIGRVNLWNPEGGYEGIYDITLYFPATSQCGNGDCEPGIGENCTTCPIDCGSCGPCIVQPPNQANGIFSDIHCEMCGTGMQFLAEQFILDGDETVQGVKWWGGYYPGDVEINPSCLEIIIYADDDPLNQPGSELYRWSCVNAPKVQTGLMLFGVHEWEHTYMFPTPPALGAGTYWIEIYEDTTGSDESYFWEVGDLDPANGIIGQAYSFTMPETPWDFDAATDMAFELICAILECGDGTCDAGEDCLSCPADCGLCGCDGYCSQGSPDGCYCDDACHEFGDCCPDVCDFCPDLLACSCGDGNCDPNEDCANCPADCSCPPGQECLDGVCAPVGACCDGDTGVCEDGVLPGDCVGGQLEWFEDALCGEIECFQHTGACCDSDTGVCVDNVMPGDCVGAQQEWSKDTLCADLVPPCAADIEACCHMSNGTCTNVAPTVCRESGGVPLGAGSVCEGDGNGNGIDDACENEQCDECGPGDHWIDDGPCEAGTDTLPSGAVVGIDVNLDCEPDINMRLHGPTVVVRSGPRDDSVNYPGTRPMDGHMDVIDTEIVSMVLTSSAGMTMTAGSGLGALPLNPTYGAIAEQPSTPAMADSFFEVFFEVDDGSGMRLYNQIPLRVEAKIDCLPPDTDYIHPMGCIPLFTSPYPGKGVHVANLVTADHGTFLDCGSTTAGDCFEPNGTPYCDNEECCLAVCEQMSSCCDVDWSPNCAELANEVCPHPCDPPDCNDGVDCTVDFCDESTGTCVNTPDNALCDDGDDCTSDVCDPPGGCFHSPEPAGTPCDDPGDTPCDDPDTCNGQGLCDPNYEPAGTFCSDGIYCNGEETCDGAGTCRAGDPILDCCKTDSDCDDGIKCTQDLCDTANNTCSNDPIAGCCASDGDCPPDPKCRDSFCDLVTNTCELSDKFPDCCTDDSQCPGKCDICDPATNTCFKGIPDCCDSDDQCPPGPKCFDSFCDLATNTCELSDKLPGCCTSDLQCGKCETCDLVTNTCNKNVPDCCTSDAQCPPDPKCRDSFCDLATNTCELSDKLPDCCKTDPDCDDELYCNGEETCDGAGTCQAGENPCTDPALPFCNEDANECVECLEIGDVDGDGDVDLQDFAMFHNCDTGPVGPMDPPAYPPVCRCFDADDDGDVDLADFADVQRNFSG